MESVNLKIEKIKQLIIEKILNNRKFYGNIDFVETDKKYIKEIHEATKNEIKKIEVNK
jgi:hypothetical protein